MEGKQSYTHYHFSGGIPAELWGPPNWIFDHAVSLQNHASAEEEKHYYSLHGKNLSCGHCTTSYKSFRQTYPYSLSSQPRQLSHLLHQAHNSVNTKNKKPSVSYETNVSSFATLSPEKWILALVDALLACSIHQIHRDTSMTQKPFSGTQAQALHRSKLPIHRLVLFLVQSSFLSSAIASDETGAVKRFLHAAQHEEKSSLTNPSLYNLRTLSSMDLDYLAQPFVVRLEKVRNYAVPAATHVSLQNRAKVLLAAKNQ